MTVHGDTTDKKHTGNSELTVTVFAPRTPDGRTFTFQRSERVGATARVAADAFGYQPDGNPTFATGEGVVLDRDKPLASARVRDGDELELVDVGGGV